MTHHPGPKGETIRAMFGAIAKRYDRANNVLSFGVHHVWKRKLVRCSKAKAGDRVLDCASGTGDLARAFHTIVGPGQVVATDFCQDMLREAAQKALQRGCTIHFDIADVTCLPFREDAFDVVSH